MPALTEGYEPIYRVFVADLLTDLLIAELPCSDIKYGHRIRLAGEFSGSVPALEVDFSIDLYQATMPGRTALYVTRNNSAVWGGIIWGRSYDVTSKRLAIDAASFESYFYHRLIWVTLNYANTTDQYELVRDLLFRMTSDFNTMAGPSDPAEPSPGSADIGIEVEDGFSGETQDTQTYRGFELKNFGEVLAAYSDNMDGFEYHIEVEWVPAESRFRKFLELSEAPPLQIPLGDVWGGARVGLDRNIFEYPGNILTFALADTSEEAATRFWVVGGVEGAETDDATKPRSSWTNEDLLSAGWPLLEEIEASEHSSVSSLVTLSKYAERYGRRATPPGATIAITVSGVLDPQLGTYRAGEWCRLIVKEDRFVAAHHAHTNIATTGVIKRILAYEVQVPNNSHLPEIVTLELGYDPPAV